MRTPHTMSRHRRVATLLAAAGALLLCPNPVRSDAPGARYELTLRNTNDGQNFSPPVIILHTGEYRLFEPGEPASAALWLLAEDGATAAFEDLAGGERGVRGVIVGAPLHRQRSPVFTTRFEAPGDSLVSVAAMLSLTNDGFVAARAVPLPGRGGASTTVALRAYDAGSEANIELCTHVPCETHGRRMTEGAEGSVAEHPGIRGDADIPIGRAWTGPELGTLTITRLP
jgi:Spondin_N